MKLEDCKIGMLVEIDYNCDDESLLNKMKFFGCKAIEIIDPDDDSKLNILIEDYWYKPEMLQPKR